MKRHLVLRCSTAIALSFALASCTFTARSGPAHQSIDEQASTKLVAKPANFDYALVEINNNVAKYFDQTILTSFSKGFGGGRGTPPQTVLGVGDVVSVTIFEAQSGGLFIPTDAGSRPGNYITLPQQTVDRNGMISVPYAGDIRAVGRTAGAVQRDIEDKLASRAIEPQAIVSTSLSRSTSISVLGDVNSPARLEINPNGERVLDILARAGGISGPGYETYVSLERNNRKATVLFRVLTDKPAENVYVLPGDTIFVNRERRTYLVFGATEQAGRVDFEDSNLSLGEAIAKTGGLNDDRADPAQVFLYREVPRETLRQMGVDLRRFTTEMVPTVFRVNMRDPASFFALQQFKMKDKDVIYVSNSDSLELSKFLVILNDVSATTANIPANSRVMRRGF